MKKFELDRIISLSLIVTFTDGENIFPRKINIRQLVNPETLGICKFKDEIKDCDSFDGEFGIISEDVSYKVEEL